MEETLAYRSDKNHNFNYSHSLSKNPESENFYFHTHNHFEIFIFLKGRASFVVESINHPLSPYDILLIRWNELHRIFFEPNIEYERIVLSISKEFFTHWHCEYLAELFDRDLESRFIPAETVIKKGIFSSIERIEKYIKETTPENDVAVSSGIIDLIYNLGKISPKANSSFQNNNISRIISYINSNLSDELSLDDIAEKFYMSKYHMCRLFKEVTSFTIYQYITAKRLLLVKQLCEDGYSLSNAATEAGFGCYSNFYKAYVKQFGNSPKKDFKKN